MKRFWEYISKILYSPVKAKAKIGVPQGMGKLVEREDYETLKIEQTELIVDPPKYEVKQ